MDGGFGSCRVASGRLDPAGPLEGLGGEGARGVGLRLISLRVAWRILFHKPGLLAYFSGAVGPGGLALDGGFGSCREESGRLDPTGSLGVSLGKVLVVWACG